MTERRSPLLKRPVMREQFRKELRGRLMSEAVVGLAPRPTRFSFAALLPPPLATAAILGPLSAGPPSAPASRLPGAPRYPVKRAGGGGPPRGAAPGTAPAVGGAAGTSPPSRLPRGHRPPKAGMAGA